MKELSPNRPYLLRAYYEWLMDNELTPHVVIDAYVPNTHVPQKYVKDGQIVLNIASGAVSDLMITNDSVTFSARFGGVLEQLYLPMASVIAIYARENGAGTVFDLEDVYQATEESPEASTAERDDSGAQALTVVDTNSDANTAAKGESQTDHKSAATQSSQSKSTHAKSAQSKSSSRGSHLTLVK